MIFALFKSPRSVNYPDLSFRDNNLLSALFQMRRGACLAPINDEMAT